MIDQIAHYLSKLRTFEKQMQKPHYKMNQTINQVQAEEQDIQSKIGTINSQIQMLQNQIQTDREAIATAKKTRTKGIVETIFGVVLAPFTGGVSLILAGIGVATISEAEGKTDLMQSEIGKYQKNIVTDQNNFSRDQKIIATLKGLSMSMVLVISDMALISSALDALRTTWNVLDGELSGEIQKLTNAMTAQETVVIKAWYQAAYTEWDLIVNHSTDLNKRTISSTGVTIG